MNYQATNTQGPRESRPLPFSPAPQEGESLMGYLMKLAIGNGYDNLAMLFDVAGYSYIPRDFSRFDTGSLASLAATDTDTLNALAYRSLGKGKRRFLGKALPTSLIYHDRVQFCPKCLEENFHFPAYWDLALVIACPRHGTYLVSECPHCARPLRWDNPAWNRCSCGYDLTCRRQTKTSTSVREISTQIAWHFDKSIRPGVLRYPQPLLDADPTTFLLVMSLFGQWEVHQHHQLLDLVFFRQEQAMREELLIGAHKIFSNWPKAFYCLLDRIRGRNTPGRPLNHLHRDFGSLYSLIMLSPDFKTSHLDFIREAFVDYGKKISSNRARNINCIDEVERLKLYGPSSITGLSPSVVRKIANAGGLSLREISADGLRRRIDVSEKSLKDLEVRLKDRIRRCDLNELLGLRHPVVNKLIESGLFHSDATTLLDGRSNVSYSRGEVNDLLAKIEDVVIVLENDSERSNLFPLIKAFASYGCDSLPSAKIVTAIIDRNISAYVEKIPFKLCDIMLNTDEMHNYVISLIARGRSVIDIKTACKIYDMKYENVAYIVTTKKVKSTIEKFGCRRHILIYKDSLRKFIAGKTHDSA